MLTLPNTAQETAQETHRTYRFHSPTPATRPIARHDIAHRFRAAIAADFREECRAFTARSVFSRASGAPQKARGQQRAENAIESQTDTRQRRENRNWTMEKKAS